VSLACVATVWALAMPALLIIREVLSQRGVGGAGTPTRLRLTKT